MTYLLIYIWGMIVTSILIAAEEPPKNVKELVIAAVAVLFWPVIIPVAILQRVLE